MTIANISEDFISAARQVSVAPVELPPDPLTAVEGWGSQIAEAIDQHAFSAPAAELRNRPVLREHFDIIQRPVLVEGCCRCVILDDAERGQLAVDVVFSGDGVEFVHVDEDRSIEAALTTTWSEVGFMIESAITSGELIIRSGRVSVSGNARLLEALRIAVATPDVAGILIRYV